MNRDNIVWWVGMVGGIATAVVGHFDLFPWIPDSAQHVIEIVAFIAAVVSGKLATSPLPGKPNA